MDPPQMFRYFANDARGESPLYERLALALADDPDTANILLDAPKPQRMGVLLLAAVHYLLLCGAEHPLRDFYTSAGGTRTSGDPYPAFREFCTMHREEVRSLLQTRNTQTNEVRRATAIVLGLSGERVALVEPGASAGLNLMLDRFHYDYGSTTIGAPDSPVQLSTELRGKVSIPDGVPTVVSRVGLDVHPVDVHDDKAMLWLRACLWPEQTERAARFAAASEIARRDPPRMIRGNAGEDLLRACDGAPDDALLCVFHSAMLPYLTPENLEGFKTSLLELSKARPVRWVGVDSTYRVNRMFPDVLPFIDHAYGMWRADIVNGAMDMHFLARVHYHGDWIEWTA